MHTFIRTLLISVFSLVIATTLAGCGTLFGDKKVDYQKSAKLKPLEVPPDLTQPASDTRYAVPDPEAASGSAVYSTYSREHGAQATTTAVPGQSSLLPTLDNVRVERSGAQRWLVVKASPEQVWPLIRQFWLDSGYQVKTENVQTGVIETEWLEGKPKMQETGIRGAFQRALGSLYSTGLRDKFRTRLERGADGSTEIYISHRGMEEIFESEGKDRTIWQPRPSDPELEAEMLRKLLVKFGADEEKAKTSVASASTARARLVTSADKAGQLLVTDPFDRAWRRVGLALDRIGFTVEDRDRSKGTYFVRYIDPQSDTPKEPKGFLSKLKFWKGDSKVADNKSQYRIRVTEIGGESTVDVENAAGTPEKSSTGNRILGLLFDQLK
jgi:outer membrane protein assembly factor BamC